MIQEGRPWEKFKPKIVEAFQMFAMSKEFGWTPSQIRALSSDDYMLYTTILTGRGNAKQK